MNTNGSFRVWAKNEKNRLSKKKFNCRGLRFFLLFMALFHFTGVSMSNSAVFIFNSISVLLGKTWIFLKQSFSLLKMYAFRLFRCDSISGTWNPVIRLEQSLRLVAFDLSDEKTLCLSEGIFQKNLDPLCISFNYSTYILKSGPHATQKRVSTTR